MKQTVKEVEKHLSEARALNSHVFDLYAGDKRIGVQKAIIRQKKILEKEIQEDKRLDNMLFFEREAYKQGFSLIAGIDEVGRGPLAGPVVAAAVILPKDCKIWDLNDSKKIPKSKHKEVYARVIDEALAVGIGIIDNEVIDEVNIYQASKLAMMEAVKELDIRPDYLLIDAMKLPIDLPQKDLVKGDARSMSIAAASIVAKVTRDALMEKYDETYPGYDFSHNAGYGTKSHLEGLDKLGVTPIHRKTFEPVRSKLEKNN